MHVINAVLLTWDDFVSKTANTDKSKHEKV